MTLALVTGQMTYYQWGLEMSKEKWGSQDYGKDTKICTEHL